MFLRRASSSGRGAGEKHMWLGVTVSRSCLCGGHAAVGGARGEKQLGNGAGRHCVCAAGEKHMGGGASTWAGTACVRVRAAGEKHMGGGASP